MCDDYQCCQVMQNIWYRSHDDDIPVLMGQPHFSPEFNNKFSMVFFLQSTKLRWSAKHYKDHLKAWGKACKINTNIWAIPATDRTLRRSVYHSAVETFKRAYLDHLAEKQFQHKNEITQPDRHFISSACNCACGCHVGLFSHQRTHQWLSFVMSTVRVLHLKLETSFFSFNYGLLFCTVLVMACFCISSEILN